jgi:hypothetical protein
MAKSKKEGRPDSSNEKAPITDQGKGPQQLYEDRKFGHPNLKDTITSDLKKVRHRVSKNINKRLLNSRESKSSKSNK